MIEGSYIELKMNKVLLKGMKMDSTVYTCRVHEYEAQEEKLLIEVQEDYLQKLQLDANYHCRILTNKGVMTCEGKIKERYQSEEGNMILFLIESGFYKEILE